MEKMWPLKKCCFCFKLETGAYTLGILGIFACPLNVYFLFLTINEKKAETVPVPVKLYGTIWSAIALIAFTMLIIGSKKRERQCLIPYLLMNMLSLILNLMALTAVAIYLLLAGRMLIGVAILIGTHILTAWGVYIWMCIYSLYLEMIDDEKNQVDPAYV
ncbi:unnamed protein product [Hermetia illucens]|uniref:Uncharacterized protein n=1 Tax=Hermetia illucens TaxID=343691 RepID=A0A7R8YM68_HERIL|nr:uncharacterized protein LOC119661523 [Hermetia illucens]CAD7078228.1 unnamed protein product [Hermetia illucens]